jgi:hypothetical protein
VIVVDFRLDSLRSAAKEFVLSGAVNVTETYRSISFRFGSRQVTVSLSADSDDYFSVLVDSEYEGTLRFKAALVDDIDDDGVVLRKELWLCEPDYRLNDGKRHPLPPGAAYASLALGIVVASIAGYYLYGTVLDLKDCKDAAHRLLNDINAAAEVPKLRAWEDDPDFLKNMVESYIYLIV